MFKNANYDFLRWRWHAIGLSLAVICPGIAVIATKGLSLGVEFDGGTIVIAQFDQPPAIQDVRSALDRRFGGESVIQDYGDP